MFPVTTSSEQLFLTLNKNIIDENYTSVIKTADQILEIDSNNRKALISKATSLIFLNRFDEVLSNKMIRNEPKFQFKLAYAYYRTNHNIESKELLHKYDDHRNTNKMNYLLAQINYKQEYYNESLNIYDKLLTLNNKDIDIVMLEQTNYLAAMIYSGKADKILNLINDSNSIFSLHSKNQSFELAFNIGYCLGEIKEYKLALKYLNKSEKIAIKTLKNSYTKDEIDMEISIIHTHKAFIYLLMEEHKKSLNIYESILKNSLILRDNLKHIIYNNIIYVKNILEPYKRYFYSIRKFKFTKYLKRNPLNYTNSQIITFIMNMLLIYINGKNNDICLRKLRDYKDIFKEHYYEINIIIRVFVLYNKGLYDKCVEELKKIMKEEVDNQRVEVFCNLLISNLYKTVMDDKEKALEFMLKIKKPYVYLPGCVIEIANLYEETKSITDSIIYINSSLKFWEDNYNLKIDGIKSEYIRTKIIENAIEFFYDKNKYLEGISLIKQIPNYSDDVYFMAKLLLFESFVNTTNVEKMLNSLPKIDKIKNIDAKSLFALGAPIKKNIIRDELKNENSDTNYKNNKIKMKRKKNKKKTTKNEELDPERWLPLKERSYYHKKGRNQKLMDSNKKGR